MRKEENETRQELEVAAVAAALDLGFRIGKRRGQGHCWADDEARQFERELQSILVYTLGRQPTKAEMFEAAGIEVPVPRSEEPVNEV